MKKALLAIDFINDIVHPEGKISGSADHVREQDAIAHTNQALTYAREHDWLTIFIKVGFDKNYHAQPKGSPLFGQVDQVRALEFGSFGTEFHEDLNVLSGDCVIKKPRVSAFYGTALEAVLRSNKIEHLYLCGVSTSWAIQSAARDAHDRDYRLTVIEDACAASCRDEHQMSIQMLSRIAEIVTVKELG